MPAAPERKSLFRSVLEDIAIPDMEFDGKPSSPMDRFVDKIHVGIAKVQERVGKLVGVDDIMQYAAKRPKELGFKGDSDGTGDALRHLLLAGEMHRTNPMLADTLLYGHEGVNILQGARLSAVEQDLYNNKIGKEIGRIATSRKHLEELAISRLRDTKILPSED
jgi:hypothetical protein